VRRGAVTAERERAARLPPVTERKELAMRIAFKGTPESARRRRRRAKVWLVLAPAAAGCLLQASSCGTLLRQAAFQGTLDFISGGFTNTLDQLTSFGLGDVLTGLVNLFGTGLGGPRV
jgi:hypothetical protein